MGAVLASYNVGSEVCWGVERCNVYNRYSGISLGNKNRTVSQISFRYLIYRLEICGNLSYLYGLVDNNFGCSV
jgi:hypothetical protein